MADDCEIASEIADRWLAGQIAYAKMTKPADQFTPNGRCRWCKEELKGELAGLTFCPPPDEHTPGCRDDWQKHQKQRELAGAIR